MRCFFFWCSGPLRGPSPRRVLRSLCSLNAKETPPRVSFTHLSCAQLYCFRFESTVDPSLKSRFDGSFLFGAAGTCGARRRKLRIVRGGSFDPPLTHFAAPPLRKLHRLPALFACKRAHEAPTALTPICDQPKPERFRSENTAGFPDPRGAFSVTMSFRPAARRAGRPRCRAGSSCSRRARRA